MQSACSRLYGSPEARCTAMLAQQSAQESTTVLIPPRIAVPGPSRATGLVLAGFAIIGGRGTTVELVRIVGRAPSLRVLVCFGFFPRVAPVTSPSGLEQPSAGGHHGRGGP